MKLLTSVLIAASTLSSCALGQIAVWGQCGGINQAPQACVSGNTCVKLNDYYYQCQPGAAAPTSTFVTSTVPAPTSTPPTSTPTANPSVPGTGTPTTPAIPAASGKQIRGVKAPIYHLYLQETSDGTPVMAAESSSDTFIISGSIQNTRTGHYLNIQDASTSYKPVKFETTKSTTGWTLEGDTITTANGSPWGRQLNFIACSTANSGQFQIYLQTGSATPSGQSCTMQTIHLPCLC